MNGQLKTVRYYPYFSASFDLTKSLLEEGFHTAGGCHPLPPLYMHRKISCGDNLLPSMQSLMAFLSSRGSVSSSSCEQVERYHECA